MAVSHDSRDSPDEGATLVEYAFLLVFIAVVAAAGMLAFGGGLSGAMGGTGASLDEVPVQPLPDAED